MTNSIIAQEDFQAIVDRWLKAELEGETFPVDFDLAWQMAGYSEKGKGKRRLLSENSGLIEGQDYVIDKGVPLAQSGKSELCGRSVDRIVLSCDAFKHFCLLAKTEQGRSIRQYFIDAEKKWKLVQTHFPQVANEVTEIQLKTEYARLEGQRLENELKLLQFRQTVTQTCPEPVQQKIFGYSTIEKIEYRDRIIQDGELINDGSTISKTELCQRYKFLTRGGKPNYKQLNWFLEKTGTTKERGVWKPAPSLQDNLQLSRDYIPVLDKLILECTDRQLNIGE